MEVLPIIRAFDNCPSAGSFSIRDLSNIHGRYLPYPKKDMWKKLSKAKRLLKYVEDYDRIYFDNFVIEHFPSQNTNRDNRIYYSVSHIHNSIFNSILCFEARETYLTLCSHCPKCKERIPDAVHRTIKLLPLIILSKSIT